MTTIFWHDRRLYADSNVVDGTDSFASLTKVKAFPQPLPFTCKEENIDDVIYGYVATGSMRAADQLAHYLQHMSQVDTLLRIYSLAAALGLSNLDNFFEAIFIGHKANYSIALPTDLDDPILTCKPHDQSWVIGSGKHALRDIVHDTPNPDPIRLMYAIYLRDSSSRGLIDVWQLFKRKGETVFDRVGICRGMDGRTPLELTGDMYAPYPFDWTLNPRAKHRATKPPAAPKQPKLSKARLPILPR